MRGLFMGSMRTKAYLYFVCFVADADLCLV